MNINEAIDDLYTILGQHNGEYMDYASYEAAVDNLNIISNFVAGTRWTPVSERLPSTGEYLVTDGDLLSISFYSGHAKCFCGDEDDDVIANTTHWMPLPETPDVQSKENIDG